MGDINCCFIVSMSSPGSPPIHPGGDYFLESALPLIKPFISKAGASLIYKACWGQAKPKTHAGTDLVSMIEQIIQGTCQELRRLIKEGNSANRQKIIGHLPLALRKGAGGHGKDYDSGSLTKGGWDPKGKK